MPCSVEVLQGQDASLALGLVAHIGVLVTHINHHTLVPRVAHNGGEDGPGSIVACEAGFAQARAIVTKAIVIHGELVSGVDWRPRSCEKAKLVGGRRLD